MENPCVTQRYEMENRLAYSTLLLLYLDLMPKDCMGWEENASSFQ
jgi:hypothetical protein